MTNDRPPRPELSPPSAASPAAGWYADPTAPQRWRWWDGHAWTTFVSAPDAADRKPRLPRWLSVPVLVCAPIVLLLLGWYLAVEPVAVVAGLVPFAIVLPALSWLDRVEPEPLASRVHAVLWGATVAVLVSIVVNTAVAFGVGEIAAMVVSAPLIEEATKALGIVWAVRRREVDGVTDGIVYAGWVAIGFAVVEDVTYFATASVEGALVPVFVLRAILTPFAHPLFTFWTGLAIGRAAQRGRRIMPSMLWGFALAVGTHALWNGSLAFADIRPDVAADVAASVVALTALLFVVLFVSVVVALVLARRREQRRFVDMWPFLVRHYALSEVEATQFVDWRSMRRTRRDLPRRARASFDRVHAALARLSALHEGLNDVDRERERVVAEQLRVARYELAQRSGR